MPPALAHIVEIDMWEMRFQKESLEEIISSMGMVAEGVNTTKVVHELSKKYNIEMPISNSVYEVLFKRRDPKVSVKDLMIRRLKKGKIARIVNCPCSSMDRINPS